MEDRIFNETIYSLPGIGDQTTDAFTYKLGDLQDISVDIPNTTSSTFSSSSPDGNNTSLSLNSQESRRLVGIFFLMVCTITGNIILIAALMCKRSRRIKRVNVFIVNLAISDLAVAFITMSTEILFVAFGEWVLGPAICKISVYLEIVTLAAATFLLTAMSIDRYQVIVKPLESLTNRPKIWIKVTIAWCLAFIIASPQVFIFSEKTYFTDAGRAYQDCKSNGYKAEWQRKLYFTFFTCYILIIPAIVMTYCYFMIIRVIWRRSSNSEVTGGVRNDKGKEYQKQPASPRMSVNRNLVSSSRRKVVKLTLTVIVGFLVCLTPYFIVSLVRIYSNYTILLKAYLPATEMIFMTHSALNPILFGIFTFRFEHLSHIVPKVCKRCLFDGLKEGVAHAPSNQRTLRGTNGQMRLIGKLHKTTSASREKQTSRDSDQTAIGLNVYSNNSKKPLLRQPVVQTAVVVDTKQNGSVTMHLLKPVTAEVNSNEQSSDSFVSVKGRAGVENSVTFNYDNVQSTDTNKTVDTDHTCNDADKELTEYVSSV